MGIFSQNSRFQEFWTIWTICFVYIVFVTTSLLEEISLSFKKGGELTFVSGTTSPASSPKLEPKNSPSDPWELPANTPLLFWVREQEFQVVSGTLLSLLLCCDLMLRSLGYTDVWGWLLDLRMSWDGALCSGASSLPPAMLPRAPFPCSFQTFTSLLFCGGSLGFLTLKADCSPNGPCSLVFGPVLCPQGSLSEGSCFPEGI